VFSYPGAQYLGQYGTQIATLIEPPPTPTESPGGARRRSRSRATRGRSFADAIRSDEKLFQEAIVHACGVWALAQIGEVVIRIGVEVQGSKSRVQSLLGQVHARGETIARPCVATLVTAWAGHSRVRAIQNPSAEQILQLIEHLEQIT
jgi:hypothetical protein